MHCPLLSLGKAFSTHLQNMPSNAPYLTADAGKVADIGKKLSEFKGVRKIGLAWPETFNPTTDRDKICPPDKLSAFSKLPDTRFFALQTSTITMPDDLKLGRSFK